MTLDAKLKTALFLSIFVIRTLHFKVCDLLSTNLVDILSSTEANSHFMLFALQIVLDLNICARLQLSFSRDSIIELYTCINLSGNNCFGFG